MRVTEHRPPTYSSIPEFDPVILLAGSASGWQNQAVEAFQSQPDDDFTMHLAIPYPAGRTRIKEEARQDWEEFHTSRAAEMGGVLLWFDSNDDHHLEIAGEVFGMHRADRTIAAVIGIDPTFKGNRPYLTQRANQFDIPIFKRLDKACQAMTDIIVEQM